MSGKIEAEYGSWKSPISSSIAAGSDIQIYGMERDGSSAAASDTIYWVEQRPADAGRNVVCSWDPVTAKISEWTPSEYSVKTKVHEYGGGSFCVFQKVLYFVNKADQQIYVQKSPSETPCALTAPSSVHRYADLHYSEFFDCVFAVCEEHPQKTGAEGDAASAGAKIPQNYVAAIDPRNGNVRHVVEGADFYACPRTSRTGVLMWMEWNFPNMPWDDTFVKWCPLKSLDDKVADAKVTTLTAAKKSSDVAFTDPSFTYSGQILYISDETNWSNLYMTNTEQSSKVCLDQQNQDLGFPMWVFGFSPYSAVQKGDSMDTVIALSYGKEMILLTLDPKGGVSSRKTVDTGFKFHNLYIHAVRSGFYAIGFDAKTPMTLFYMDFATEKVTHVKVSSTLQLEGYMSEPQEIEYPTGKGDVSYGYYYPPTNKDFTAPPGTTPPVLVKMHGGPTARSIPSLNPKIQFYTSRGFGVLDVNYRGSSGYGRKYRQLLNLQWGVSDCEDAVNGVKYLAKAGLADKDRLCITGSSAGGLSVLNALLNYDTFKAGASHYGVADLEGLVHDTHKFEMRYLDILIGEFPAQKAVYDSRSPIIHKEKFKCPCIFFQGLDDFIVPPQQSENMYRAVKDKGLPCAYVTFEGEGHGFTKKENIQKALDTEYAFFVKIFGINAPHVTCEVPIENL